MSRILTVPTIQVEGGAQSIVQGTERWGEGTVWFGRVSPYSLPHLGDLRAPGGMIGRSDVAGWPPNTVSWSRIFSEYWAEMKVKMFSLLVSGGCTSSVLSLGSQAGRGADILLWIWRNRP